MRGAPGAGGGSSAGVSSFNTRTGPVTLVSADVSGALGYTPANSADLAGVALSGAYADLLGLPAIPAAPGDIGAATAAQGAKADTAVQPGELASVAASGSYADLSAKPFIPALPGDIGAATAAQGAKADTAVQPAALTSGLAGKVDKDGAKVLSDQNYTLAEKNKLAGLDGAPFKGLHINLAALQSAHPSAAAGDYADVDSGTGADVARYIWDVSDSKWVVQSGASGSMNAAQIKTAYESNPDTNGFSDAEKSKLGAIAAGATANATNAELRDRSTHTGTQVASTISDFAATVRATVLTGLSLASGAAITATDSALIAWGKLQKQITDLVAAVAGKQDTLVSGTTLKTVNGSTLLGAGNLVVTGGDMLSTLLSSEVSVTGAVTLTSGAFGKMHLCSGTTADYTVSLPAASGNTGKIIGFRMAPGLTKIVSIDASGSELIDGQLSRVMWANEAAILLCDGTGWSKIAGKSIPMYASAYPTGAITVTNVQTLITLDAVVSDQAGMADLSTNRINIKRPGIYTVTANVYYSSGAGTSAGLQILLDKSAAAAATGTFTEWRTIASTEFVRVIFDGPVPYASGDYITMYGAVLTGAYRPVFVNDPTWTLISIMEIPTW